MPIDNLPEWTLTRRRDFTLTQIWKHTTGDLGLVLNLITSEIAGSTQETPESIDLATSFLGMPDRQKTEKSAPAITPQITEESPDQSASQQLRNLVLGGNLAEVELPGILQSISLCKMTGRLDCYQGLSQIEIFFDEGTPVHATAQGALQSNDDPVLTGDHVILDILTWDTGTFHFNPVWTTSERTVRRRLEIRLLEDTALCFQ